MTICATLDSLLVEAKLAILCKDIGCPHCARVMANITAFQKVMQLAAAEKPHRLLEPFAPGEFLKWDPDQGRWVKCQRWSAEDQTAWAARCDALQQKYGATYGQS